MHACATQRRYEGGQHPCLGRAPRTRGQRARASTVLGRGAARAGGRREEGGAGLAAVLGGAGARADPLADRLLVSVLVSVKVRGRDLLPARGAVDLLDLPPRLIALERDAQGLRELCFGVGFSPLFSCRIPRAARKLSYRSDSVTRC